VLEEYWFPLTVGTPVRLVTETTLYIGVDEFREPDFLFWPRSIALEEVTAASALLIVEVADTSLRYDLQTKAPTYAKLGLREYWVIDAVSLVTSIHRDPGPDGYPPPREAGPHEMLEPMLAPHLAVRLADLGLTPQR
jgi:Uma2 family endonuclease